MRIDEPGAGAYLLNSIWENSLFKGILEQSLHVNMLHSVDIEPRLPSDREDLYHRAVDLVRARVCDVLGEQFYGVLRETHGPPVRYVDPIPEAHSVLMNIFTFVKLKDAAPWGERRVVCTRFMEPGLLWYVGDLGDFRHSVAISAGSKPLSWQVRYEWGLQWASPLSLQCIDVAHDVHPD